MSPSLKSKSRADSAASEDTSESEEDEAPSPHHRHHHHSPKTIEGTEYKEASYPRPRVSLKDYETVVRPLTDVGHASSLQLSHDKLLGRVQTRAGRLARKTVNV